MIYEKLQKCRVALQNKKLKKSGKNSYAGFEYFELADFLPIVNEMFLENKMFSEFSMNEAYASLKIYDIEDNSEVEFTTPIAELELKGCNKIQALGGTHTYLKRYLYINALEIVEADLFDSITGKEETKPVKKTQPKEEKKVPTEVIKELLKTAKTVDYLEKLWVMYKDKAEDVETFKNLCAEKKAEIMKGTENE